MGERHDLERVALRTPSHGSLTSPSRIHAFTAAVPTLGKGELAHVLHLRVEGRPEFGHARDGKGSLAALRPDSRERPRWS